MSSLEHLVRISSRITSKNVEKVITLLVSSQNFLNFLKKREIQDLQRIDKIKKILIIPDINIGDAINFQAFLNVLKKTYPQMEISYIYKNQAYPLVKANPNIDRNFPLFTGSGYPTSGDLINLRKTIKNNHFDLIINFCPFISSKDLKTSTAPVISPLKFIVNVIRAYITENINAHISYQLNRFAYEMIKYFPSPLQAKELSIQPFNGNYIYTNNHLYLKTQKMMNSLNIKTRGKKIFFNPDTSSPYTQIPFSFQVELLQGILSQNNVDQVLLNAGHTFQGIEKELLNKIPYSLQKKIIIIPKNIPIDTYAALIDNSELFISGDTGPLHIAAARKVITDADNHFKNSTGILGIFGATSPRIYGYDSFCKHYQSAPQHSPSKSFEGTPFCKNLTCTHKNSKLCSEIRCFQGLNPEAILHYIKEYLSNL